MDSGDATLWCLLIILFGVPVVFNNVSQDALTQAMIVVAALIAVDK